MKRRKRRRTERLAWTLGVVGGTLTVILLRAFNENGIHWSGYVAGFLLGGGFLALPMALYASLYSWIMETDRQQRALINVRNLTHRLPLELDSWAVDPHFANVMVQTVLRERPKVVVECGSGSSTVLLAATLRELGTGHVISLEHEADFAQQTRDSLTRHGLESWAEVISAPLGPRQVDNQVMSWYAGYDSRLEGESIDMLVVDGPPKETGPRARYPAVPLLQKYLSNDCVILLDDGRRSGERKSAEQWAKMLPASRDYVEGGRGVWILRSRKQSARAPTAVRAGAT